MSIRQILVTSHGSIVTDPNVVKQALHDLQHPVESPEDRAAIIEHLAERGVTADDTREFADPIGGSDVVVLHAPMLPTAADPWVGFIDDWGMVKHRPINMKAWALYGRSPIYGPMVLRNDDPSTPIPAEFIRMICLDVESWVPFDTLHRMYDIVREGMGL